MNEIIKAYIDDVKRLHRSLHRSLHSTDERSMYTALDGLFSGIGEGLTPKVLPVMTHPFSTVASVAPPLDATFPSEFTEAIHQFTTFDEDEENPKVEPAAPDFNL